MKRTLIMGLMLLCASGAWAQSAERDAALRSLVEAEREFSRTSAARGMRAAFLSFLADDGIIFPQGVPANGKEVWRARENTAGLLTWRPVFAEVSAAGDLGYTTGPYEFRNTVGEAPAGYGYYMSVWRKGADGAWKVVLDLGTRNPPPVETPALELAADTTKRQFGRFDVERERGQLLEIDREFSQSLLAHRPLTQLLNRVSERVRVHRMNSFPRAGREAMLAELRASQGRLSAQPISGEIARSGDLGYTYGAYKLKGERSSANASEVAESGAYLRVWRRGNDGRWKLVVDLLTRLRNSARRSSASRLAKQIAAPELNVRTQPVFRKFEEALVEIFKLKVEMYPQVFNPYYSFGKAYAAAGERELAIKNYKRSLELNPRNTNAVEALKRLVQK